MEDKNQEEEEISRHERKGDSSVQDLDKCQAVALVRFMTRFMLLVAKERGGISTDFIRGSRSRFHIFRLSSDGDGAHWCLCGGYKNDDDDDDVYYSKGRRPREDEEGEESYEKQRQWPGRGG